MVLKIDQQIDSVSIVTRSEHNVTRINSVKSLYNKERNESKAPTFALTQ